MVVGGGGVDPDDGAVGIQRGVDQRGARGISVLRRDTVFQIQDHHIGRRCGLGESLGTVGRAEQPAGSVVPQCHQTVSSGRLRTMVFRDASATTSPC